MFNITATPVTTVKIVVELDEQSARAILVDPAAFQAELRARLADGHNGKHGAKNITFGKGKRAPKAQAQKKRAHARLFVKRPCANCGKRIGLNQLKRHEAKCRATAVSTASSD